jgi:hypothetical protein
MVTAAVDQGQLRRAVLALRAIPEERVLELVEEAARDLLGRREARRPRGRSGRPPRCQICHRFTAGWQQPCRGCGYDPCIGWAA